MAPARSDDLQRILVDRVARRVEGRGVPRAAVDAAVGSVVAALAARAPAATAAPSAGGELVAAVTARSMPDLASRLRAALGRAGVDVGSIGIAASGLHNVATLRVSPAARASVEDAVRALGASVTFASADEAR